jgi:PAS domain S-box-containing protein
MTAPRRTSVHPGAGRGALRGLRASRVETPRFHISPKALEHFVEAVPVGVFSWTMNGRVLTANDRFLSTIGYNRADLQAGLVRWTDLTPPEFVHRDQEAVTELLLTGRNKPYEKEYIRKDGSRVPVLLSSVTTDDRGTQGIAFALDLTEQQQLTHAEAEREAALRENERLYHEAQEANRLKDEFVTMLSHELRTPLNAVLGWLTMLKRGGLDAEQRDRAIEIIERNVRIQAQLLSDLLDINRLSRGRIALDRMMVNLTTLIEAVLETMRPVAEQQGIALELSLGEPAGEVRGDPVRLQQIVWNLLSNALKFTPEGGRVHVHAAASRDWIDITVSDTGTGISPEFLPFIFDRFKQEPTHTRSASLGVGLGLPIVKQLVELHGGSVGAHSAGRGQGATFTVRLPRADRS